MLPQSLKEHSFLAGSLVGLSAVPLAVYFVSGYWIFALALYPAALASAVTGLVQVFLRRPALLVLSLLAPVAAIGAVQLDVRLLRDRTRNHAADFATSGRRALAAATERCGEADFDDKPAGYYSCDVTKALPQGLLLGASSITVVALRAEPPRVEFLFRQGSHLIVHYSPGAPFCYCEELDSDVYFCGALARHSLTLVEKDRCIQKLRSIGDRSAPDTIR